MSNRRLIRGRATELGILAQMLSAVESEHGRTALVMGDRGSGKTRLVQEVCRMAEERGFRVSHPGAEDLGRDAGSPDRPVLAVMDDTLLSADGALLSRMTTMLETRRDQPWLSLVTLRNGAYGLDVHRYLSALEESGSTCLQLKRLQREAVRDVLTDLLGAPPHSGVMELADGAKGNPLLVVSLARGLIEDGHVEVGQREAVCGEVAVPARIRTMVTCMLNELDSDTRTLVEVVAAMGPSCRVESLFAVLPGSAVKLAAGIRQAVDAGVLEHRGDELAFRYELVRWAIAETTPSALRQKALQEVAWATPGPRLPFPPSASAASSFSTRSPATEPTGVAGRAADLSDRLRTCLLEGRASEAHDLATLLLGARRPYEDTLAPILALVVLSACARLSGYPSEALKRSKEAASLALCQTDRQGLADVIPFLALELVCLGESVIAEWLLQTAGNPPPPSQESLQEAFVGIAEARLLALKGELRRADETAERVIGILAGKGYWRAMPLAWTIRALAVLRNGQAETAAGLVAHYKGSEGVGLALYTAQPEWVALQTATEQEGPARGVDLLLGRYADLIAKPLLLVEEPGAAPWMVRTALAAGALQVAKEVMVAARRLADDNADFTPIAVSALHAEGLYEQDADSLARAGREHRDPWAAAWAWEDLAGLLERRGTSDRLDVALGLAMAYNGYERAGDRAGAGRVLACLGRVPEVYLTRHHLAGGQENLSGSERAVVELVVQGMTNRQVANELDLSPNTVSFHLRNVFRKFGIGSRVELARHYRSPHSTASSGGPKPRSGDAPRSGARPVRSH